jgi:histidyl-tRNA synthetase
VRAVVLIEQVETPEKTGECEVFLLADPQYQTQALILAESLRDAFELQSADLTQQSIRIKTGSQGSLKSQMKKADQSGARFAVILGEREIEQSQVTVKILATGEQETWLQHDLVSQLIERFTQV